MLQVKRVSVKTYKIIKTTYPTPFSKYGDMYDRAKELGRPLDKRGFSKCFVCKREFSREDDCFLGIVLNHKNVFLCEECAKKVADDEQ